MFDPTIFDNLKVVLEGELYDLDLEGEIKITDRKDQVDLATMSRHYQCSFSTETSSRAITATVHLKASSKDLYGEILEITKPIGASLILEFRIPIYDVERDYVIIDSTLKDTWHHRPVIDYTMYTKLKKPQTNTLVTSLTFNRLITEAHISDITSIIQLLIKSVEDLGQSLTPN